MKISYLFMNDYGKYHRVFLSHLLRSRLKIAFIRNGGIKQCGKGYFSDHLTKKLSNLFFKEPNNLIRNLLLINYDIKKVRKILKRGGDFEVVYRPVSEGTYTKEVVNT